MAFALKGAGSASTDWSITANQASFVLTTSTTVGAANDLAVLRYAVDNNATADGDEVAVTAVADSAGNFWQKAVEFTNGQGTAQTGATCGIWYCNLQNALAIGATITLTFSNATSRDAAAVGLEYFTKAAGFKATINGTPGTLANDAASAGSLDVTTDGNSVLRIRATASESSDATAWTKTAAFTAVLTQAVSTGGVSATNQGIRGEYLVATAINNASAPTGGAGAVDNASVHVAFKETAFTVGDPPHNSDQVAGAAVAGFARKAATALLITASAWGSVPFNTPQPQRAANFTNFGWSAPLSVAPKVAQPQQGHASVPFNTPQLSVNFTNFGWHPPTSTAALVAKAQPGASFVPLNTAQLAGNYTNYGWYGPLSPAPPVAKAQLGTAFVPFNTVQTQYAANYTNLGWHGPTATAPPVAKAQVGNSFVPFNTAQVAAPVGIPLDMGGAAPRTRTVYVQSRFETPYQAPVVVVVAKEGWQAPLSGAPAVAKAQVGHASVPYNTAQLSVNFTNFGWHGATATAAPVAKAQAGYAPFVPYNTAQLSVNYTDLGWYRPLSPAPPVAQAQAGNSFVPYNTAQVAAFNYTNVGWYNPLSGAPAVAKAQAGNSFVPYNTTQIVAASGIPLNIGDAPPRLRNVYYQRQFVPPDILSTVVAAAYTNFWLQPLSIAVPVARAVSDFGSLALFTPAVVSLSWQQPLSSPLPLPKAQAGFAFVPYNTAQLSVNYTDFDWYAPLSTAAPVAKPQLGYAPFVPFNTAQLAVNYTNFGWYSPLAGAPPVAKAQPGYSFVPFNTAQVVVSYFDFYLQPLSVAAPVAKAQVGFSYVPFNTAQLAVNYTNFTWSQPLSTAAPVARATEGFSYVPYNTAQLVATPYTAYYQQPLSIAVPVARAAPGFWFVPFDTVQVAPPSELGGTTSRGGGSTATGGFCRKKWKKCLEEIRQQLADEQASLKAAKQRHEEIDYAARAARIAAIHASAEALEAECAAESLAVASARIERFIDKLTRIEADYQAALLRQFEEDEDDVLTILLT